MAKKISFREKHVAGPPRDQSWIWHTADMRTTEKWRKMPLMVHRLLERIELEHLAHSRQENGRLGLAYSQFVDWGMSRRSIPAAIDYAVEAGFLEVTKRGYHLKNTTNEYRLTYLPTRERVRGAYEWSAPTNEWKRRAGKSFFSRAECDTHLGQNMTLTDAAQTPETAETLESDLGQNMTLSNILRSYPPARVPHAQTPPAEVSPAQSPLVNEPGKLGAGSHSTNGTELSESNATEARVAGERR
jgi:hypothetical protein